MNTVTKYIEIFMMAGCVACSNWLDVRPRTEMKEEDMYSTENGFKNVLTGAYIRMASKDLYGENVTMSFTELLAQHWKTSSSGNTANTLDDIRKFNFENEGPKNIISTMWLQYYKTIASLNNLLSRIDGKKELFTNGNYELIKGEALGLRAFLHFDILRLWGPVPAGADMGQAAIPYLTEMTKDPNKALPVSYQKVLEMILSDLNAAEDLLVKDPIIECKPGILNQGYGANLSGDFLRPEDEFQYYRSNRFNYYAVEATKARYYQWIGDKAQAVEYAQKVIDALNPEDNSVKFPLTDALTNVAGETDRVMSDEHIFSLHNPYLEDIVRPLFMEFGGYTQDRKALEIAYETTVHPNDIRWDNNEYWENITLPAVGTQNMFKKYWETESTSTTLIPVIRIAEMYFIVMDGGSLSEAQNAFSKFRIARNMDSSVEGELVDANSVQQRLEKEYRKEFYGEGQMFFYYKRNGVKKYTWPQGFDVDVAKYVIPRPDEQIVFE